MDWTQILKRGGVPDSPGYRETCQLMQQLRQERQQEQARAAAGHPSAAALPGKGKAKRRGRR